jgi:cell division protein FtsB
MSNGTDILLALMGLIAGLEVALYVFRGVLFRAHQAEKLERQIKEAQDELRQIQDKTHERQAEANAARDGADKALALLRQASRELADSQRPREVLVHRLGEPGPGMPLFRASLHKMLPETPEENQRLVWSYESYVDVWATNPRFAYEIAARHFTAKAGYTVGSFAPVAGTGEPAAAPAMREPEVAA